MSEIDISPFTLYRWGYEDGYYGRIKSRPADSDYMTGYEHGHEDDQLGAASKYSDDANEDR